MTITPTEARNIIGQAQNTVAHGYYYSPSDLHKLDMLIDELIHARQKLREEMRKAEGVKK